MELVSSDLGRCLSGSPPKVTHLVRTSALFCSVFVLAAGHAHAADWARELFPVKSHDFGTVAVAAKTEFEFPIHNATGKDIHISNVRASCGCTTPILKEQWVKAGETGSLVARFNTGSFHGKKGATLTVVIDRPSYAEVQLRVDGYIRRDIVFNPGSVEFGKTDVGQGAERRVALAYAGRSDWQIVGVDSTKPFLSVAVEEKTRSGQRVDYDLVVTLSPETPPGFFQEELVVRTNDRSAPRVPLAVTGDVEPPLIIAPQAISTGALKPGGEHVQKLVVRAKRPCKITDIACEGMEVDFSASEEAKAVHVITVRLVANDQLGAFKNSLVVKTDEGDSWIGSALVTGEVVSP